MADMIDTSTGLLPCPFCGEYPHYAERWDEDLATHDQVIWKSVTCGNDCASFSIPDGYDCGTAIERWNRRAIPAAQVTVTPLGWFDRSYTWWAAQSEVGVYYINEYDGLNSPFKLERPGFAEEGYHPTLEAAKAAAQADYEARIRSALTVTTHDPAKVQALVEAGERMTGPLWRLILADEHCLKSPCDMPTCECRQKFDRIAGPWTATLAAMKEV